MVDTDAINTLDQKCRGGYHCCAKKANAHCSEGTSIMKIRKTISNLQPLL